MLVGAATANEAQCVVLVICFGPFRGYAANANSIHSFSHPHLHPHSNPHVYFHPNRHPCHLPHFALRPSPAAAPPAGSVDCIAPVGLPGHRQVLSADAAYPRLVPSSVNPTLPPLAGRGARRRPRRPYRWVFLFLPPRPPQLPPKSTRPCCFEPEPPASRAQLERRRLLRPHRRSRPP